MRAQLACGLMSFMVLSGALPGTAQQKAPADANPSPTQRLKKNPDDADAFNAYMAIQLRRIGPMVNSKPDEAERAVVEMERFISSLAPTTTLAKRFVTRAEFVISGWKERLALGRISLEELTRQLRSDPNDRQTAARYISKLALQAGPMARAEPEKAATIVSRAKRLIASLSDKIENRETKRILRIDNRSLLQLERQIAAGRKRFALIGTGASRLGKIDAWVNGSPLTDEDLAGKVVILDFWAVWSDPCVSAFPQLRKWHEKYRDKGLVVIGVTRYYNYEWDSDAKSAGRSEQKLPPATEQAMLAKFAGHHRLAHRIAVQSDGSLLEHYHVTGIPHLVVIDQTGKIRSIRVGSDPHNATVIGTLLEALLGKPDSAGP